MIPISLKIKGLYSYQEEVEIDFTKLASANLFGIFGSVGSGKSAILEAIGFALYGETERLNKSEKGGSRGYHMMNLKSNELKIEFCFQALSKEDEDFHSLYKFIVQFKRNGKNFDDVKTPSRKAYIQINGNWEPLESVNATEIIGLTYENFRRTVIIPQGKFQEFLKLSALERTKMLKEIFQLQKFDLSENTSILEKENIEKKQHITGQLSQLGSFDIEKIKERKKREDELKTEIQKQNQAVEKKEIQMKKFEELLNKKEELEKVRNDEIKSLAQKTDEIKIIKEKLETKKNDWEKLKKDYENRHQLETKTKELENIKKIKESEKETQDLIQRFKKGEVLVIANEKELETLKNEKKQIQEKQKEIGKCLSNITNLSEIRLWLEKENSLKEHWKQTKNQIKNLETKLKVLEQKEHSQLESFAKNISKFNQLEELEKSLSSQLEELRIKAQLSQYAEELKEGKPCLLCGSLNHPNIQKGENLKNEINTITESLSKIRAATKEIEKIKTEQNSIKIQHTELKTKLSAEDLLIKNHQEKFKWQEFKKHSPQEIENLFLELEKKQKELKSLTTNLELKEKAIEQKAEEIQRFKKRLEEISRKLNKKLLSKKRDLKNWRKNSRRKKNK